jgi:hypothetical protein
MSMSERVLDNEEAASYKRLRSNLKQVFKDSGVLSNVRAQIRKEFISGLGGNSSKLAGTHVTVPGTTMKDRILLSSLYQFLKSRKLEHSVSVFVAEIGADTSSFFLSDDDIARTLGIRTHDLINTTDENREPRNISLLENIMDCAVEKVHTRKVDSCMQTEAGFSEGPLEAVELHIRQMRQSLYSRKETADFESSRTVEEKMIAYQRECEDRYRQELELRVRYIKENEIAKVRVEESRRAHAELDLLRKELEADYKHRLQMHSERETESIRKFAERERINQQTQYEAREKLQRQLDDLRDREKAASRKIDLEGKGLHMLELRMKEMQAVLESREREVSDREKSLDRRSRECLEKAHAEARSCVQVELDSIMREKMSLILDRQRLEDERASQSAWLESAHTTRTLLREAQTSLLEKNDELKILSGKLARLENSLVGIIARSAYVITDNECTRTGITRHRFRHCKPVDNSCKFEGKSGGTRGNTPHREVSHRRDNCSS